MNCIVAPFEKLFNEPTQGERLSDLAIDKLNSCSWGKDVIYSQDLGYSILGLRILNPGNLVLGLRFKDPES